MNRAEKVIKLKEITNFFNKCESAFILDCPKLNVEKSQLLRRKLYVINGKLFFAKNTLLKIVAKEIDFMKDISLYFNKKIAIVFAFENSSDVASAIKSSGYGSEIFFNAGILFKKFLDKKKFEFLSNIPSEKILKSNVCGVLKMPIIKLVSVLNKIVENKNQL